MTMTTEYYYNDCMSLKVYLMCIYIEFSNGEWPNQLKQKGKKVEPADFTDLTECFKDFLCLLLH